MHFQHRSREILGLYNRNRIRTGVQLDFSGLPPRDGGCPATRPDVSWMRCASVAAAAAPAGLSAVGPAGAAVLRL